MYETGASISLLVLKLRFYPNTASKRSQTELAQNFTRPEGAKLLVPFASFQARLKAGQKACLNARGFCAAFKKWNAGIENKQQRKQQVNKEGGNVQSYIHGPGGFFREDKLCHSAADFLDFIGTKLCWSRVENDSQKAKVLPQSTGPGNLCERNQHGH